MVKFEDNEIQPVLEACREQIEKLTEEYKASRRITDFEPVVKVYPIGVMGFNALLLDKCDVPLGSVTYFEGCVVFTSFEADQDIFH